MNDELAGASPPELVIFDCDGVLVDSEPIVNRIMVDMLTREGFPMTLEEAFAELKGLSLASCWQVIEQRFGRPLPADFPARLSAAEHDILAREVRAIPDVAMAIAGIPVATCVASSGAPEKIRLTLGKTGLLGYFEPNIFSASEVPRGKPHPDLFLYAAERMGKSPASCVVVEDAVPGIVGARAAGMRVLGYAAAPYADHEAMRRSGAQLFNEMRELPRLLGFADRPLAPVRPPEHS